MRLASPVDVPIGLSFLAAWYRLMQNGTQGLFWFQHQATQAVTPMASWYSATVGMWPSLDAIAVNSALAKNTLVFLPKRLGKLRVLVEITVAP